MTNPGPAITPRSCWNARIPVAIARRGAAESLTSIGINLPPGFDHQIVLDSFQKNGGFQNSAAKRTRCRMIRIKPAR